MRSSEHYGTNAALRGAVKNNHASIIGALLQDPRVDPSHLSIMELAASLGHLDAVHCLLKDRRVNSAAGFNHALLLASQNGHAGIVDALLRDEAVVQTYCEECPLMAAAVNGHVAIVELLLASRLHLSVVRKLQALKQAGLREHWSVVKLLLQTSDSARIASLALETAAEHGPADFDSELRFLDRLLRVPGVDPSVHSSSCLRAAAKAG